MNGGADLGGMHGFGPVAPEPDEPLFHAPWEARVMAMVVGAGRLGQWNLDQSRFARESLPPPRYQSLPYYAIWKQAFETLLLDRGMVTADELATGEAQTPAPPDLPPALTRDDVASFLRRGGPVDRPAEGDPLFEVGDAVETLNLHPRTHTRLPRYARGRRGRIARVLGHHVFPDTNAKGEGENPQWLYQVRFAARELWGPEADPLDTVTLDLWEPYLRVA